MKKHLTYLFLVLLFIPFFGCQQDDKVEPEISDNTKRLKSAIEYNNGFEAAKSIYFYENNKIKKVETYIYSTQNSEWIHIYDGIFSYENNIVSYIMQPTSDSLPIYFKSEYTIENETLVEEVDFSKLTGEWEISNKFHWFIHNSRLDSLRMTSYFQGNPNNSDKWIYQYENNEIKLADLYLWNESTWFVNYRYEFSLKADTMIIDGFHNLGDEFKISFRNKRIVQNSKTTKSLEYVLWAEGDWQLSCEENYLFNSDGYLKEYQYEDDSENTKVVYEYENGTGNLNWFIPYDEHILKNPFPAKNQNNRAHFLNHWKN